MHSEAGFKELVRLTVICQLFFYIQNLHLSTLLAAPPHSVLSLDGQSDDQDNDGIDHLKSIIYGKFNNEVHIQQLRVLLLWEISVKPTLMVYSLL